MAAIATITIPTSENPLATGWDTITGLTACKSTAGAVMQATSGTVNCGVVDETGYTAVDSATVSKGVQAKWSIGSGSGLESGSAIRFIWGYTDQNNYLYARLVLDGTTVFTTLKRNNIRLYKRVAGVETELTADSALKRHQLDIGDLRFDPVVAGTTTFRIVHTYDQIALLMNDYVIRQETSTGITSPSGKVGVVFEGLAGGHTNEISLVQAALITAHWTDIAATSGDTNNIGSRQDPYQHVGHAIGTVAINTVTYVVDGTYLNDYDGFASLYFHISSSNTTATNYEEGPLILGRSDGAPYLATNGLDDPVFVSGESGLDYWQFSNLNIKGTDETKGLHLLKVLRGAHVAWVNCTLKDAWGVAIQTSPTQEATPDYSAGSYFCDITITNCGQEVSGPGWNGYAHTIYSETQNNQWRYLTLNGAGCSGYAFHLYHSSKLDVGDGNIVEYCHIYDFDATVTGETTTASAGILLGRGSPIARYNLIERCFQGITMGYAAIDAKAYWNIVVNCTDAGIDIGEFGCTTGLVENNTFYGNGNYGIRPVSGNTSVTLKNNISFGNTPGEIGSDVGTVTKTTNMIVDPGFAGAAVGNFHLATDTNPPHEAGTANTSGVPSVDYDGWNVTGIVPIGAYDFIPPLLDIANVLNSTTTINEDAENIIDLAVTGDGLSLLVEARIRASQGTFTTVDVSGGATSDT